MNQATMAILVTTLVPIVIMLLKMAAPKIPKALLPILAILLPVVGDLIAYYTGLPSFGAGNPLIAAILGGAGVAVREVVDQLKQLA